MRKWNRPSDRPTSAQKSLSLFGLLACLAMSWPGTSPALASPPGPSGAGQAKRGEARQVRVEVLPGQSQKLVDPALAERIPVGILGSPDLDVRDLDPLSLTLGG